MAAARKATVLEINLISAQELPSYKASSIHIYVVAWIDRQRKLTSRVDGARDKNPTWNDKFIFAVDKELAVKRPHCTLVFDIYCKRRYRKDKLIGKVNVLLESLMSRDQNGGNKYRGEVMAFYVRTPSGEPQGILNIGVRNVDGLFARDVQSFLGPSLAIDYRKMMGGDARKSLREDVDARHCCLPKSWRCWCLLIAQSRNSPHRPTAPSTTSEY